MPSNASTDMGSLGVIGIIVQVVVGVLLLTLFGLIIYMKVKMDSVEDDIIDSQKSLYKSITSDFSKLQGSVNDKVSHLNNVIVATEEIIHSHKKKVDTGLGNINTNISLTRSFLDTTQQDFASQFATNTGNLENIKNDITQNNNTNNAQDLNIYNIQDESRRMQDSHIRFDSRLLAVQQESLNANNRQDTEINQTREGIREFDGKMQNSHIQFDSRLLAVQQESLNANNRQDTEINQTREGIRGFDRKMQDSHIRFDSRLLAVQQESLNADNRQDTEINQTREGISRFDRKMQDMQVNFKSGFLETEKIKIGSILLETVPGNDKRVVLGPISGVAASAAPLTIGTDSEFTYPSMFNASLTIGSDPIYKTVFEKNGNTYLNAGANGKSVTLGASGSQEVKVAGSTMSDAFGNVNIAGNPGFTRQQTKNVSIGEPSGKDNISVVSKNAIVFKTNDNTGPAIQFSSSLDGINNKPFGSIQPGMITNGAFAPIADGTLNIASDITFGGKKITNNSGGLLLDNSSARVFGVNNINMSIGQSNNLKDAISINNSSGSNDIIIRGRVRICDTNGGGCKDL